MKIKYISVDNDMTEMKVRFDNSEDLRQIADQLINDRTSSPTASRVPDRISDAELERKVKEFLRFNEPIDAMKFHRENRQSSLVEAKNYVDTLRLVVKPLPEFKISKDCQDTVISTLVRAGYKLLAVRFYRELSGQELDAAKIYVDSVKYNCVDSVKDSLYSAKY